MYELAKGRQFQLWEYHVSHGSLLMRSPAGTEFEKTIDIICVGVEYISAPRHLGEITVVEATDTEIRRLEEILEKTVLPRRIWVFQSQRERFLIVAAHLKIREAQGDIFDSPFRQL